MSFVQPCTIRFRARPERAHYADGTLSYWRIRIPKLGRRHCYMLVFRTSEIFGGYANSDLFNPLIARAIASLVIGPYLDLTKPMPTGVSVDATKFLHDIIITLEGSRAPKAKTSNEYHYYLFGYRGHDARSIYVHVPITGGTPFNYRVYVREPER